MKRFSGALAVLVVATQAVHAQQPQDLLRIGDAAARPSLVNIQAYTGMFMPVLPLVAIGNGRDASVELESAPLMGAELELAFTTGFSMYGGMSHVRTRVNHSTVLETRGPARPDSPVQMFVPTGGFIFSLPFANSARLSVRLGAGVKFYDFDLPEVENGIQDLVGDAGLGLVAGEGPISVRAEARWTPSQFDPAFLPIRIISYDKQLQNDWMLQVGVRIGL